MSSLVRERHANWRHHINTHGSVITFNTLQNIRSNHYHHQMNREDSATLTNMTENILYMGT